MAEDNKDSLSSDTSSQSDQKEAPPATWGRRIEFTLTCVGYSVGLGNLCRFPYLCMRNGGGAFLIPYAICTLVCGLPMFVLELTLAQFSSCGAFNVWKFCPLFRGVGISYIILEAIISIYYNVMMAWIVYFLIMSFRKEVPWKDCGNSWNTPSCVATGSNMSLYIMNDTRGMNLSQALPGNWTDVEIMKLRSPADEYWHNKVLDMSDGIEHSGWVKWDIMLCLMLVGTLIFLCLFRGIKTSGKVMYVAATLPYLFLIILLIRGVTLPGSLGGIKYFIIPDWQKLKQGSVWAEAALQVFYSLGPAWGGLIAMASHNNFNNRYISDAIITCMSGSFTSFFAGFVIFSVIGFMAHTTGLPMEDVVASGPGLAFIAYPQAIAQLPISPLWAICFFLMLLIVGLDSQFVCLEMVISGIIEVFPRVLQKRRTLVMAVITVAFFLLGLPLVTEGGMYVYQIIDWYMPLFTLFIIAFLEAVVVVYIYGVGRVYYEMEMMTGQRPSYFWVVMWGFVTPSVILGVFMFTISQISAPFYGDYTYPAWAIAMGFVIALISTVPIPIAAIYLIATTKGTLKQRLYTLIQPDPTWGPILSKNRVNYKYDERHFSWRERFLIRRTNYHQVEKNINGEEHGELMKEEKTDFV